MNKNNLFIFTQFLSELGSSITSFGIILWINSKNPNTFIFSLLAISIFLPKILFGIIVGSIVDRMEKKKIILLADFMAAICSIALFILFKKDIMNIGLILILNFIIGIFSCFQNSAKDVIYTIIFTKEEFIKLNGAISFLSGIAMLLSPILGAILYNKIGMEKIILLDISSFIVSTVTLLAIKLKSEVIVQEKIDYKKILQDFKTSYLEIKKIKELKEMMIFFIFVNLFSGMTYFSLVSPLILKRTGNNGEILGMVNMFLGLGFILGGLTVSLVKIKFSKEKVIYMSIAFSFLLGDLILALGHKEIFWYIGAFFASYFIPFSDANKAFIWQEKIPLENRGKIYAFRTTFESLSRPLGMLLGGIIVEKILRKFVSSNRELVSQILINMLGAEISLLFIFTGSFGFLVCLYSIFKILNKEKENIISLVD